jgi:hypothetical protein
MTEDEAAYEESKWSEVRPEDDAGALRNGRPWIVRWEPDRYCDEPEEDPVLAKRDSVAELQEAMFRSKVRRDAIFFAMSIDNLSRTKKSAKIRKEAARFLMCKHEHPVRIASG